MGARICSYFEIIISMTPQGLSIRVVNKMFHSSQYIALTVVIPLDTIFVYGIF